MRENIDDPDCSFYKKPVNHDITVNKYKNSGKKKFIRVRDHDEATGKFREAAHVVCDLKARSSYSHFMPMVLHIMFRFDSHLFMREIIQQKQRK